jgi:arabinofuranosyltransferase
LAETKEDKRIVSTNFFQMSSDVIRWRRVVITAGILLASMIVATLVFHDLSSQANYPEWMPRPAEDAFILFRYSENLADGHGIRWNIDRPPVDGATDFLWMGLLAAWGAVFGSVIPSVYFIGLGIALAACLLPVALLRWMGLPIHLGIFSALWIIVSPIIVHVVNGFGVPFYALVLGTNMSLFLYLFYNIKRHNRQVLIGACIAILVAGLSRPEGALFGIVMLIVLGFANYREKFSIPSSSFIKIVLTTLVIPGLLVLIARQAYFGEVLPAPFFVKTVVGESQIAALPSIIKSNLLSTWYPQLFIHVIASIPVLLALWLLRDRALAYVLFSIAIFTGVYLMFTQTQNVSYRFQYPTLYLTIVLSAVALGRLHLNANRRAIAIGISSMLIAWALLLTTTPVDLQLADDRWQAGEILAEFQDRNYTLATTESGVLPYRSQWVTLYSFGLNHYEIGKNGITEQYWRSYNPAVVLNHTKRLEGDEQKSFGQRQNMYNIMRAQGVYEPAAIIHKRYSVPRTLSYHVYFVDSTISDFEEIKSRLQNIPGETYAEIPQSLIDFMAGD